MFVVGDLLRKHCVNVDGHAVYDDGWSDHKIIETLRESTPSISKRNVENLRVNIIGRLAPSPGSRFTSAELINRLDWMTTRIEELTAWAHERPVAPFKPGPKKESGR
jgi:hypothetical protein